ncbi:putative phage protein [Bacillus licheniformis DSM 13 = ATCC 14580]|nr:putative phage protein [Bacillus licheniformis DSM 13 = ATCC 14580]
MLSLISKNGPLTNPITVLMRTFAELLTTTKRKSVTIFTHKSHEIRRFSILRGYSVG